MDEYVMKGKIPYGSKKYEWLYNYSDHLEI